MGARQKDGFSDDLPPVSEEDFLALETADSAATPAPVAGIDEAEIERAGFAPATAETLRHLMPGCFVLALIDDAYCWAEVESVEGEKIGARLHNELMQSTCLVRHHTPQSVFFHRDQIKALGCERYCWC